MRERRLTTPSLRRKAPVWNLLRKLRALCQGHPRLGYTLLFRESAGTLQEIAANPRHLGAELGFLGVLHTWTEAAAYGTSGGRSSGENGS